MEKLFRCFFFVFLVVAFCFIYFFSAGSAPVSAATIQGNPDIGCRVSIDSGAGVVVDALSFGCLAQVIVNIVQWAYGFSLLAGMGYFIFGGITFMMAQDEKGIKAGRDKMIWAVFGFVFIVVSFLIVRVVFLLLGIPDLLSNFSLFVKP